MSLNGKQIRYLRGLANGLESVLIIGKNDITDAIIEKADQHLEAHELLKGSVGDGSGLSAREAGEQIAEATEAELVQVIGHRFVLYRETNRKGAKKIQLPC